MMITKKIINHAAYLALVYNFSHSYASAETKLTLLEKVYSNGNNDAEGYLAVSYEKSDGSVVNVPIKRGKRRTSYKNDDLICQRLGFEAAASKASWSPQTYSQFVPKGDCGAQYLNMINGDIVTMDDDAFEDCLGSVRKNGQVKYASKYIKCVNDLTGLYLEDMTPLVRDTLLSDSVQLFENWHLSFDIQVNSILSDWSSIVHLTNGVDNRRMPGVWFFGGSYQLHISSTQTCDPVGEMGSLHSIDYETNWQDQAPGTVNNVRIVHYGDSAGPAYTGLWIDGVLVEERSDWTDSCDTGTVNLWAANPWFVAADASIGNLVYKEVPRQD